MKPQKQLQNKGVYFKMTLENKKALKTLVFQKGFTIKLAAQKLSNKLFECQNCCHPIQVVIDEKIKPCLVKNASKINNNLKIISQTGGVKVDEKVYCQVD